MNHNLTKEGNIMEYKIIKDTFIKYCKDNFPQYLDATFYRKESCHYPGRFYVKMQRYSILFVDEYPEDYDGNRRITGYYEFPPGAASFIVGIDVLKILNELFRIPDYTIHYYLLEMKSRGVIRPNYIDREVTKNNHEMNFLEVFRQRTAGEWVELIREINDTDPDFCNKYARNTKYFLPMACDGGMLYDKLYDPQLSYEENIGKFIAEDIKYMFTKFKPLYRDYNESYDITYRAAVQRLDKEIMRFINNKEE